VLEEAAEQFDSGPRSFPLASESGFAHKYGYDPPNEDYQKLFWRQTTVSNSQRNALFCPYSAGWLILDETSICKPVFVAYSVLLAIWLLRETLAEDALPDDAWVIPTMLYLLVEFLSLLILFSNRIHRFNRFLD
jgi:hypothetical protein